MIDEPISSTMSEVKGFENLRLFRKQDDKEARTDISTLIYHKNREK